MGDIALAILVGAATILGAVGGVYYGARWLVRRRARRSLLLASSRAACTCSDWPGGLVEIDPVAFARVIDEGGNPWAT